MRPQLGEECTIGGICLIRLEGMKPKKMGLMPSLTSENAAHRFAVLVERDGGEEEAVYVPRRARV
jgi:hypothetical protein